MKSKTKTENILAAVITTVVAIVVIAAVGSLVWITMPPIEESVWTLDGTESGFAPPKMPAKTWTEWAYHFQALIGGVFAVVAAFITVTQMRISDSRAEHRHHDLLSRQDDVAKNRAERFLNPAYDELCQFEDWANRRIPEIQGNYAQDMQTVRYLMLGINRTVCRPQLASAEDLLDGQGAAARMQVIRATQSGEENMLSLSVASGSPGRTHFPQNDDLDIDFRELREGLKRLIEGMERVADRHGIMLTRAPSSHTNNDDDTIAISVANRVNH